jgi:hypothetical protein
VATGFQINTGDARQQGVWGNNEDGGRALKLTLTIYLDQTQTVLHSGYRFSPRPAGMAPVNAQ